MNNEELEHYLSVYVELDLFPKLRLLAEGTKLTKTQVESERTKQVVNFINNLPKQYRNLPNCDYIIAKVLARMDMKTNWAKKKLEEQKSSRKEDQPMTKNKEKEER